MADWKVATPVDLSQTPPAIAKGSDSPKMTIEEFADFRCVHCKHAGPSIKAFINSHHDVKLKFYTFPLDGSCNQFMEGGGDGVSCFLAKSVYCAEKITQKGWALHDYIYATQEKINQGGMEIAKTEVAGELEKLQVPLEPQKACVESTDTDTAIRAQAQAGKTAGLKGTPLFIINGRRLDRGQLLPVLEGVYREL